LQIDTRKLKKLIIKAVPYVAFSYVGNLIGFAYRTAEGDGFQEKILPFMSNLGVAFARIFPSLHPFDLLFGLVLAGVMRLVLYVKSKNKKKFRQGEEYGSAVWGGEKDIEPYMDLSCPENNVILTKTESLTMGKPSAPKFARNKNILVIGGSGSGKTRFFVKPNLMQMHSSYVVTDPKGTVLVECGKMLERGRPKRVNGKVVYRRDDKGNFLKDKNGRYIPVYEPYKIKVFNTIDFAKSMTVLCCITLWSVSSGLWSQSLSRSIHIRVRTSPALSWQAITSTVKRLLSKTQVLTAEQLRSLCLLVPPSVADTLTVKRPNSISKCVRMANPTA